MAQSMEKEPETGTGITPYWPKNKINPPVDWEDWIDQFFLASDLKEKCQTRSLLNPPDAVVEERNHYLSRKYRGLLNRPNKNQPESYEMTRIGEK